jgi:hypothetical protein
MNAPTINVEPTARGGWEVVLPVTGEAVRCPTLDDAVREGYRRASVAVECELVVHDAYHRVVRRERVVAVTARR